VLTGDALCAALDELLEEWEVTAKDALGGVLEDMRAGVVLEPPGRLHDVAVRIADHSVGDVRAGHGHMESPV